MRSNWQKWFSSVSLVALVLVIFLTSCSFERAISQTQLVPQSQVMIDWVDFVQFNGKMYVAQMPSEPPLQESDLGEVYSTVQFKLEGNVFDGNYQVKDGDASYLEVGTSVYTLKNHDPATRLAAYRGSQLIIYEMNKGD